jgi:hypothetical protein
MYASFFPLLFALTKPAGVPQATATAAVVG